MKITKNVAATVLFFVTIALAIAFVIQTSSTDLWEKWFNFTIWLFGFWFGSKTVSDIVQSVWYKPELDEKRKDESLSTEDR